MTVLNLDYAGLISVVITFTALVPILGAYIGGAIGVLLLLFISPGKALLFLVFLIVLQQFEGNVIYPRVVGRKIGLPGIWVLVAISVGSGIMGIWGMLIGVPLTTILYQLILMALTVAFVLGGRVLGKAAPEVLQKILKNMNVFMSGNFFIPVVAAVAALFVILSAFISVRIMEKKEF